MKINIQISQALRSDPEFEKALQVEVLKAHVTLAAPGKVKTLCIHETGHFYYFALLGKSLGYSIKDFDFVGPTISYNGKQFIFTEAAVTNPFRDVVADFSDETLFAYAKGVVAGGVFVRELRKGEESGDAYDRNVFHERYNDILRQQGQPALLEKQLWRIAQRRVKVELTDPRFKSQVICLANQFETEYF